jgi:hypothetical protein
MTAFKTAYVHIGMHKTGTTSIQQTMARHRAMLRTQYGVVYPSVSANHSMPLVSLFCDDPAGYSGNIIAGATDKDEVARRTQGFADSLRMDLAAGGETMVLSGEDLGLLNRRGVQRFKAWLGEQAACIRILAYVREPVAWATSHAQQQVRQGRTLEELMERALVPRFRRRLTPWIAAFGRDHVGVADFDVARSGPDGLIGHFLTLIGLPGALAEGLAPKRANPSLSAEAVVLMSALNAVKPTFGQNGLSPERRVSLDPLFARIEGRKFSLPPQAALRSRDESAEEVAWLAEQFGVTFTPAAGQSEEESPLFDSARSRESLALLIWELNAAAEAGDTGAQAAEPRPRHRLTQRPQARVGKRPD